FPQGVTRRTMTNDISNLSVTFLWFLNGNSTNYVLRGNPLTVGASGGLGGIQCDQTNGEVNIECDLNLQSSISGNVIFLSDPTSSSPIPRRYTLPQLLRGAIRRWTWVAMPIRLVP